MTSEPYGWNRMTCNFCGVTIPHALFISIKIATGGDGEFPYTQTDMCEKCWREHGIEAAFEHNASCRKDMGLETIKLDDGESGKSRGQVDSDMAFVARMLKMAIDDGGDVGFHICEAWAVAKKYLSIEQVQVGEKT